MDKLAEIFFGYIALTHMRWGNDEKLAEKAKKIDLFLGGHDHEYGIKEVSKIIFKQFNFKKIVRYD